MIVAHNKVVSIDYTLRDEQGTVLDSSEGNAPLAYIHGMGNIIPGLESKLEGKSVGDALKVSVAPADGYGVFDDTKVAQVPRAQFDDVENLEVGMQFRVNSPDGAMIVAVTKIEGDTVTVDGNHPLAGMALNFDVKIIDVRDASAEELSHGHVHGEGGHHHHH